MYFKRLNVIRFLKDLLDFEADKLLVYREAITNCISPKMYCKDCNKLEKVANNVIIFGKSNFINPC